jgi:hypothetical protein
MAQDPGLILNLFYVEESSYAIISDEYYDPCPRLPPVADLPAPGKPVRGFSFNSQLETWSMQLFFIDDQVRIKHLYVDLSTPEGMVWASLLPAELQPVAAPLYRQIRNTYGGAGVSVYWERDTSEADIRVYKSLLDSMDVEVKQHTYDPGITFLQISLILTQDGQLELIRCKAP